MSIATLKKKSGSLHSKSISKGANGFSIYGNRRILSSSGVGADSFNRSKNRTRFRGIYPMGHGGCCGKYSSDTMNSGRQNFNDTSEIKASVKNTKGMIRTKYKWMKRPYPYYMVQPTENYTGYSDYYKQMYRNTGDAGGSPYFKCGLAPSSAPWKKRICSSGGGYVNYPGAMNYETYLKTNLLKKHCVFTTDYYANNKQAFPPYVNRTGLGCWGSASSGNVVCH